MLIDLRSAFRQFAQRPALNLLVVGILALAIGANSAMFTLADAALFRGLAVHEPDRVVRAFVAGSATDSDLNNTSYMQHVDLRDEVQAFDGQVATYMDWLAVNVSLADGVPERMSGGLASGRFWQVLGVEAMLGRTFGPETDQGFGAHPEVVVSHHFWRTRLDADPAALGRVITINRHPFTLVGVLPAAFTGLAQDTPVHLWMPISMGMQASPGMVAEGHFSNRGASWLDIVARLAPGTSLETAQAELAALAPRWDAEPEQGDGRGDARNWFHLVPAEQAAVDPYGTEGARRNAWLLLGMVGALLALACANVAGLLAVRGEERQHELAVRLGLGASRSRVVRQLFIECVVQAVAAALTGLWLARALLLWVVGEAPSGVILPLDAGSAVLEPRVMVATIACAALAVLLAGLAPALRAARIDVAPALKASGKASSATRAQGLWRGALVATQVGLSVVLLVGAGLLLRAFQATASVAPGFKVDGGAMLVVDLARHGVPQPRWVSEFQRLGDAVARLPGVQAVAWANTMPVRSGGMRTSVDIEAPTPGIPTGADSQVNFLVFTDGFLETLGVPVLRGRTPRVGAAQAEVVVNERMAEIFWPGQDPIGRRVLSFSRTTGGAEVVGVVADHKLRSLREDREPAMYAPADLRPVGTMYLLIRTAGDPASILPAAQRAIQALEPELPVLAPRTLADQLSNSYAEARLFAFLTAGFAALAVLLAAAGLYGVLAHSLRLRTRELGIRMALGATRERIVAALLSASALQVGAGVLAGTLLAFGAARLVEGLLFGVTARDPLTFVAVLVLVLAVGALAAWLPARRATRIDPAVALRDE